MFRFKWLFFEGDQCDPAEKQVFQYDEQGWPLHRSIYALNGTDWELVEENSFAYDDYGHLVLDLTMTYENGSSDGYKYEYIYEENNLPYTEADYYCFKWLFFEGDQCKDLEQKTQEIAIIWKKK